MLCIIFHILISSFVLLINHARIVTVLQYKVEDADTKGLMGYFFLDLHPRGGKYGHNACFPLQEGYVDSNQKLVPNVVAMVCNFSPPEGDRPSLLSHDEVCLKQSVIRAIIN